MKTLSMLVLAVALLPGVAVAGRFIIDNSGNSFSPATTTISVGDTVVFTIDGSHNGVEVSMATWNANGTSPLAGGFSVGFGGGTVTGLIAGTHYFVCQPHASIGMKGRIIVTPLTGIEDEIAIAPRSFRLEQNYPNPFNPSTTIAFSLARMSYTEVAVYDASGRLVRTIVAHTLPAGDYREKWNGEDDLGRPATSGTYFVRMRAGENGGEFAATTKVLLIR